MSNAARVTLDDGKMGINFLIGFIEGFAHENADSLEQCNLNGKDISGTVTDIISSFKNHEGVSDLISGFMGLFDLMKSLPSTFSDCKQAKDIIPVFKEKLERFKDPKHLGTKIAQKAALHYKSLINQAQSAVDLFNDE